MKRPFALRSNWLTYLFLSPLVLAACTDPQAATENRLEGTYRSTTFTFTTPDTVFDLLEDGDSIALTLHADRTTTGTLFGPEAPISLAGHWDTTAGVLRLQFPTPIVIGRIPFAVASDKLQGELPLPPNRLALILTK